MLRPILLFTLFLIPAFGNPASAPNVPGIVTGTDRFEFTYRLTIPKIEESGRLWIPVATSDRLQKVELESFTGGKSFTETRDAESQNLIRFMELAPEDSGRTIMLRYKVVRKENSVHAASATEGPGRFVKPDTHGPLVPRLAQIAREQTANAATRSDKAAALFRHTIDYMAYDKSGTGWGRGDALHACDSRAGNCTDFHAYFIALARSIGIPARFSIGFSIPADKGAGIIDGYHCWAEYFADGQWCPVDISEADKHPELADYYASHHPANRFQISVGRDLKPDPMPESGPINFLVYPLLETGGGVVAMKQEFAFRRLGKDAE
jgi:transglutaminase-like putative cysteine protease